MDQSFTKIQVNQSITQKVNSDIERAVVYYTVLFMMNNLKVTKGEIKLVAFTAVRGNITNGNVRDEYCRTYKTTVSVIGNIVSKLKKLGIFVENEKEKTVINPKIVLDFTKNITIGLNINTSIDNGSN